MSKLSTPRSSVPHVVIDNQGESFELFLKLLTNAKQMVPAHQLRCKVIRPQVALGSKMKKYDVEYYPIEGEYVVIHNKHEFRVVVERGEHVIVTECRQLDHIKQLVVYGPTVQLLKEFVNSIFDIANKVEDDGTITIYENNGGHWRISKEKKPRKMESVFFEPDFIANVLGDIHQYLASEDWYAEMGIPYKRSYLLYGPPGTGKSSLAQAITAHINYCICFVNCSDKISDFNFNQMLNQAPKKSVILIEDVDAIFKERENNEKLNSLTFSGFLNAIDGVRSQEGRIIIMTTNHRELLDPALLRPGRVDEMYEIPLSTKYQIEKMCLRFFKDQALSREFASRIPDGKFSMSSIQGFLLRNRKNYTKIIEKIEELLQSDDNIPIEKFLSEINCSQCLNEFRMEECYSLAEVKGLPAAKLQKITANLTPALSSRLFETVRSDRKHYIKTPEAINRFIEQITEDEAQRNELQSYAKAVQACTFFVIRDKLREFAQK